MSRWLDGEVATVEALAHSSEAPANWPGFLPPSNGSRPRRRPGELLLAGEGPYAGQAYCVALVFFREFIDQLRVFADESAGHYAARKR